MKIPQIAAIAVVGIGCFFGGRSLRGVHPQNTTAALAEDALDTPTPPTAIPVAATDPLRLTWTHVLRRAENGANLDDAGWRRLLDGARLDPSLAEHIVRRWSAVDPAGCWGYIITLADGVLPPDGMALIAIEAWADIEPEAAMEALLAADAPLRSELRSELIWKTVRRALAVDMERGMALVPTKSTGGSFRSGSVEPWMEGDPEKACRMLLKLPPSSIFRKTVGPAAQLWYDKDREAAMAWVAELPLDMQTEALRKISDRLGDRGDIEGARVLALTTESMMQRQRVAADWLNSLGEGSLEYAHPNPFKKWLGGKAGREWLLTAKRTPFLQRVTRAMEAHP